MATRGVIDVNALRILNGDRQGGEPDDLGNIGICQAGRGRGALYVLVNAEGQQRDVMEERLVETIIDTFQHSDNSVTGALLDAIKAANAVLYEDNKMSFGYQRIQAGVYCAVVRPGHDLVLAYVGPAVALLVGPAGLERLYSDLDPALSRTGSRVRTSKNELGVKAEIEVSFYSSPYNPGDMLVLASPSLLECGLDDEELANALPEAGLDGLPDDCDMTVLALKYQLAGAEQAAPDGDAEAAAAGRKRGGRGGPSVLHRLSGLLRPKPQQVAQAQPLPAAAPPAPQAASPTAEIPRWLDEEAPERRSRIGRATGRIVLPALHMPRLGISLIQIATLLGIVLLIVVAIWWKGHSEAQAREQKFQNLISQAENKRSLGQASLDRTQALAHLKDADDLVGQALTLKPTAPAALALRDGITRDMDETKGITRMPSSQVTTLYAFSAAGTSPGRVVGDGSNLYVLDKGDQKVYKFVLNQQGNALQQDTVLVRKGDQVGGKVVVGDLVDIAWIPVGGNRKTANLVILESGGNLLQYDATKGLTLLPLKDATTWRKAQATGGFGGNFYVLDNLANTILRYRATTRGFDDAPSPYLQTKVELASAVDMAIDGDIFVLMVNGQVVWLSGGRPQTAQMEGLDRPLSAPVAIFTNEGTKSVYVADPSNARVVQFSKQMVVLKQFTYDDKEGAFQRLRGVFADENKLSLYVTAGTKLLHIAIP